LTGDMAGVGKLGRCKFGLGKLGLGKLGRGKLGRDFWQGRKTRSVLCGNTEILYYTTRRLIMVIG